MMYRIRPVLDPVRTARGRGAPCDWVWKDSARLQWVWYCAGESAAPAAPVWLAQPAVDSPRSASPRHTNDLRPRSLRHCWGVEHLRCSTPELPLRGFSHPQGGQKLAGSFLPDLPPAACQIGALTRDRGISRRCGGAGLACAAFIVSHGQGAEQRSTPAAALLLSVSVPPGRPPTPLDFVCVSERRAQAVGQHGLSICLRKEVML